MIKAVIFDMDGVLIEAKDWHYEAFNRALDLFGYAISRLDHLSTYDGLPTRRKLELLTLEHGLPRELHGFINELKQMYTVGFVHTNCKPRFVHQYALSRLKSDGYRLGVASNAIRSSVELMLAKAELDGYFELTLSNEDVERPKPHPEIYLWSCQRLGVDVSEALVIEDNENGVKAAIDSGAHVLVVENVEEVNHENIARRIRSIDEGKTR